MANAKQILISKLEGSSFAIFCAGGLSMSLTLIFVCDLRIESWI